MRANRSEVNAVSIAHHVRIEDEIARRGIKLSGRGPERYGPCPVCGGTDRFSINIRKNVWNCRRCSKGGDAIALVQHIDGVDFGTALRTLGIEERPAAVRPTTAPRSPVPNDNSGRAIELWRAAVPITATVAEVYLRSRGLDFLDLAGDVLRFHPSCPFGPSIAHPCMLGLFRTISGDLPVAVHRTALGSEGRKIDRKTLGPMGGAAIKFARDDDIEGGLHIGEGIETVLGGMVLGFKPAWALGSAGGIRAFPVLGGIDCLTLLVDHDSPDKNGRQAGHEAARECAERWRNAGREVSFVVPHTVGHDMADLVSKK
jgi:Toprim domain/CHC2 zinc finger